MTKKEAIKILKAHISPYDKCLADAEANEAIHLAIKALKQKTIPDDCEILTKEAYSDLCLRAARAEQEEITLEQAINRLYELGWLQEHDRILAESNGHCEFVNLPPYAKEECEDCISRQATLDEIIKELCIKDESYLLQAERKIYYTVKYMPSVKPKRDDAKDDLK